MASTKKSAKLKVTLVKSPIHCIPKHKACVAGLGLRRLNHCVELQNTPAIRGMIVKVNYLLKVEEA